MRDTSKQLRTAVFNCLDGNLSGVNVYDEKRWVNKTDALYVVLSTQQETPIEDNDCTFINRSSIDIEIVSRTGSEVTKDTIDDVSNTILGLLMPTRSTTGVTAPAGLQFVLPTCESLISRNISISETESILQKNIRFVLNIIQQN